MSISGGTNMKLKRIIACLCAVMLVGCGSSDKPSGSSTPVSYTHLDVYKRQVTTCANDMGIIPVYFYHCDRWYYLINNHLILYKSLS